MNRINRPHLLLTLVLGALLVLTACGDAQSSLPGQEGTPPVPTMTPSGSEPQDNGEGSGDGGREALNGGEPSEAEVSGQLQPEGQPGDWELVFQDEFNGASLNSRNWTTCYWWSNEGCTNSSNQNLQWYQSRQVSVRDGILRLRADERTVQGDEGEEFPYASGMVTTGRDTSNTDHRPRFSFQYGYVEVRARTPSGPGLWPAIWMLPVSHESRPEIDIMEVLGHEPDLLYMHLHYSRPTGSPARSAEQWWGPDFSQDFHTYAVHWEPDRITWYVDGVERRREEDAGRIPSIPMYLLLNLAVGGDWPGSPTEETEFPASFDIDYARVWQKPDSVYPGDAWSYRKGTSEPPADWNEPDFDDREWEIGRSSFGHGVEFRLNAGDDVTILNDMTGNYVSLYMRRDLVVEDPDQLERLSLFVDYHGGFVAYINGEEVAGGSVSGSPPPFDAEGRGERVGFRGMGPVEEFDLTEYRDLLEPGTNVIAIQAHGEDIDSSNFIFTPTLIVERTADESSAAPTARE